jgi:hypothetical protein
MLYRDLLIDLSDVICIFGAYLGICIDAIYFGGTPQNINVTNSKIKVLGRLIVVAILWYIPYTLCKIYAG